MYINNLITGTMTLGSGGSTPATRTATRVWYGNDENVYTDYEIVGNITSQYSEEDDDYEATNQIPEVWNAKKIEFGSAVTSIQQFALRGLSGLTSVMIPNSVTSIGWGAFDGCNVLTNVVFQGRTLEQVQNIEDGEGNKWYPWGIEDTSIIHVA